MQISRAIFSLVLIAGLAAPIAANAQQIPGQYIVVLNPNVSKPAAFAAAQGIGAQGVFTHTFKGFAAQLNPQQLRGLEHNPHVAWIEPDRMVYAIETQTIPTGIDRIEVDQVLDGGTFDVDVAIIDTGIDLDHPDLNVVGGVDCIKIDRKTGECKAGGDDDNGHGSHTAGTVAALDNGIGVVGVAPGARLYAVKVLDRRGSGSLSGVIRGIEWVTANADVIDVVNMSLGGGGGDDTDGGDCSLSTDAEHIAICALVNAGVTVVVAAGNESSDAATSTPAAYDEVITVSALADFDGTAGGAGSGEYRFSSCTEAEDDSFACFSNYGHDVDIIAPGVGILSTYMSGGYATSSGTSMAAPHVAGAAARLLAADPSLAPLDVKAMLLAAADPNPCAGGACADDPDGIQEPLLQVGPPATPCALDIDCDDGNECTADACDLATGRCAYSAVADDSPCAGGICCGGACAAPACSADADCADDGDTCTTEQCAGAGTCAAACEAVWAACDAADGCCGPACTFPADVDCPSGPTSLYVADVAMSLSTNKGRWAYRVGAQAQILDNQGAPVFGAIVYLTLTSASGSAYAFSGTTDEQGWTASFELKTNAEGFFSATVTDVADATLSYDGQADIETCQGLLVPEGTEVPCP